MEDTKPRRWVIASLLLNKKPEAMLSSISKSSITDLENTHRWATKARYNTNKNFAPMGASNRQAYQLAYYTTKHITEY